MKRGRLGVILVLVVSLLASVVMRGRAMAWQTAQAKGRPGDSLGGAIGGMDSFTLALLLGGLRGPLVMFLWSSSESQKTDRNLEDFDTKIEWIRRLQPEFDTVHMFQMWNKAYNISVMMASPANKFITIAQALEYGRSVDQERPGNINILSSAEQIYANKLGGPAVQERAYYDHQYRLESMTDAARRIAYPNDVQFRRLHRTLHADDGTVGLLCLDDSNRILPQLLKPQHEPRPGGDESDGSAMQYVAPYQPFPYGVPPVAMAYNTAKRAQMALAGGQKPLQLSAMVIDSQPALQLRAWGEAEAKRARIEESKAFNVPTSGVDTPEGDMAQALIGPTAKAADAHALDSALFSYALASRLAKDARKEYERHLGQKEYLNRYQTYASHLDDVDEDDLITAADHDYLAVRLAASGPDRDRLLRSARSLYGRAAMEAKRIILTYYMEDPVIRETFPPRTGKELVAKLSDAQVGNLFERAIVAAARLAPAAVNFDDDRIMYSRIINRANQRTALLDQDRSNTAFAH